MDGDREGGTRTLRVLRGLLWLGLLATAAGACLALGELLFPAAPPVEEARPPDLPDLTGVLVVVLGGPALVLLAVLGSLLLALRRRSSGLARTGLLGGLLFFVSYLAVIGLDIRSPRDCSEGHPGLAILPLWLGAVLLLATSRPVLPALGLRSGLLAWTAWVVVPGTAVVLAGGNLICLAASTRPYDEPFAGLRAGLRFTEVRDRLGDTCAVTVDRPRRLLTGHCRPRGPSWCACAIARTQVFRLRFDEAERLQSWDTEPVLDTLLPDRR
jgi:hypothetical protein